MPGYAQPKWYNQLRENFYVYLQTKNQLYPLSFSGDIAKISKLLLLDTLGMPEHTHPEWLYQFRRIRHLSACQK